MAAPRQYPVPKSLCSAGFGPYATLDEMDLVAGRPTPAGAWAGKVLQRENKRALADLLGDETSLPMGVIADDLDDGVFVVESLVLTASGEVWSGEDWESAPPIPERLLIELDEYEVAAFVRARREGADGLALRASLPMAFLDLPSETVNALTAAGEDDVPEGAVVVAVVDPIDKNAVLELLAIAPGPTAYRRHDGAWQKDAGWVPVLKSVSPPPLVKLTPEQVPVVASQVDESTAGTEFEILSEDDRDLYQPSAVASGYVGELRTESDYRCLAMNLALVAVAGRELSPKDVANTEKLRRYWLYGKGAAKIRWGTPGAWRRCYRNLVKHLGPRMTPGYCTNLSKRLGGPGIATHVGDRRH